MGVAALPVQAQSGSGSDLVLFGPASNPGGLVGFIQAPEANGTNASEFYPAFLPAAANVPNNVGVQFYEDPSRTVLSDQIWTQAGFWYFASDPNLINFASFGITPVGGPEAGRGRHSTGRVGFLPAAARLNVDYE